MLMMTNRLRIAFLTACVVVGLGALSFYVLRHCAIQVPPSLADEPTAENHRDSARIFHIELSGEEKLHILDGNFMILNSIDELPPSIKNAFATITGDKPFALANPGSKYQVTDVIDEPGLPHRRLIFAGVCKDRWFIHYEHGGIGVSYAVLVLNANLDSSVRFVWGGAGFHRAANMNDLRAAISSGKFADDHAFYW
jgi:hypothetical protein